MFGIVFIFKENIGDICPLQNSCTNKQYSDRGIWVQKIPMPTQRNQHHF